MKNNVNRQKGRYGYLPVLLPTTIAGVIFTAAYAGSKAESANPTEKSTNRLAFILKAYGNKILSLTDYDYRSQETTNGLTWTVITGNSGNTDYSFIVTRDSTGKIIRLEIDRENPQLKPEVTLLSLSKKGIVGVHQILSEQEGGKPITVNASDSAKSLEFVESMVTGIIDSLVRPRVK